VGLGGPSRERRLGPVCAVALRCELDRIVAVVDDFGQAEVSNFDLKSVLTLWYAGYSMVCWVLYGMLGTLWYAGYLLYGLLGTLWSAGYSG
jgi:hypothetical protein